MANRVEFTDKAGNVKNMDKPTAMRLQARGKGKITKTISLGNKNSAKKVVELEDSLLEAEIKIEDKDAEIAKLKGEIKKAKGSAKAQKKTPNKASKEVANRQTK